MNEYVNRLQILFEIDCKKFFENPLKQFQEIEELRDSKPKIP